MKKQVIRIGLVLALGFMIIASALSMEKQPVPNRRDAAKALMQKGNFKEALDAYVALLSDPANTTPEAANDLQQATSTMQNLGRMDELDALRERFAMQQAKSWQNLLALAQSYQRSEHHGFMIAGKFERGGHRGGGEWANAMERDYVRAMQLMDQAMPHVLADQKSNDRDRFYFELAQMIRQGAHYGGDTWHFQVLTDYKTLPDYEKGYFDRNQRGGAPVDKDGNPIFYTIPKSWEAAQSDGERWRWALSQATEMNAGNLNRVRMQLAQFWQQQFGEQTMVQHQFFGRGLGDDGVGNDDNEWDDGAEDVKKGQKLKDGPYAVHTLSEDETLAKLATGVKRFKLPDEFNYIKIYRQVTEEPKSGYVTEAHAALAQVFENRRQYVKAAEQWELAIKSTANQNLQHSYRGRVDQITKNWGRLETTKMRPADKKATVDFTFRNATSVKFSAYPIKMDLLLQDAKDYIKTKPAQLEWQRLQVDAGSVGHRLVWGNEKRYVGKLSAEWSEKLEPPTDAVMKHWDRRVAFETKLEKSGAYLLIAQVEGGNTTRVIVGLADTTIIKKQLDGKMLYLCVDAITGKAIPKANLEFFGYKQNYIQPQPNQRARIREYEILFQNFAEFSDADGQVVLDSTKMPQDYQWIITARTDAGRFAHLGFTYVGYNNRYDNEYNQAKVFTITDRPVYRPGQKVKFKFWVRHAQYDQPDTSSFAKQSFPVEIHNPKGEKVLEKSFTSDEYGGFDGEFDLPADATLGSYQIFIPNRSGGSFRVEEYKKPEYEVKVDAPTEPVMLGEKITATVKAKYYFGSPVTSAKVKYKVTRTKHDERWYPICSWDWFYGRGYCWLAYDYVWYPGWRYWGCGRPIQSWWGRANAPPEVVLEGEAKIGDDGTYKLEIDTALAKEMHGDQDHKYSITAEVVDESRRTIVGSGEVIVARKPFEVTTWIDRGYVRTGDTFTVRVNGRTLSEKPVEGNGELKLFKISYDKDGKPTESSVEQVLLKTNSEGQGSYKFVAAEPGQYRVSYTLKDSKNHSVTGAYIFTIAGNNFDGRDFRFNDIELVPELTEYKPGDKMKLQINCNQADATVYLFVRPTNGVALPPQVLRMQGKSRIVEIDVTTKDMPNFFVEALTVSNAKVHTEIREIVVPPEKRVLNVAITPSETRYKPGEKAKVKFKLTDHTGEAFVGSTVVAIYDKSVEYISGGSNVPEIKEFFWKWRRSHYPNTEHNLATIFYQLLKRNELSMNNLGAFGDLAQSFSGVKDGKARMAFGAGGNMRSESMDAAGLAAPAAAPMAAAKETQFEFFAKGDKSKSESTPHYIVQEEAGAKLTGTDPSNPLVSPTIRSNFVDTALWVAAITTGKDGTAEVDLKMPENLTNWKIRVWGMGHGTKVGQADTEVVTAKDIIVRLQAPRFFVEKDMVVLSANVHNYLKTEKEVTVDLDLIGNTLELNRDATFKLGESFSKTNGDNHKSLKIKIPAGGEQRVDWLVSVKQEGEALVRMSAKTDEDSDAMEQKFPVYVHGMLKTESFSGMLRPADNVGKIDFTVPLERRPDQSRIEVRFSPTLAGACVDALPYLAEYPYGCTEQTLNKFVPTIVTQKILQRMKLDLKTIKEKRTNLNAQELGDPAKRAEDWKRRASTYPEHNPVFDNDEVTSMVKSGVQRLTEMQCTDGGWGWFSGYGERSYPHTTAVVVHGLQLAKANDVALVPGMVERGIEWLKSYQSEQVRLLKVGDEIRAERKKNPNAIIAHRDHKMQADNIDALVYMVLADGDVKNNEMTEYLFRDRIDLAIYAKAMFGIALQKQGEKEKLTTVLENIKQFVVEDNENQTAYLKLPENNYWWCWYGSEIEAHSFYLKLLSATDPKGELAPKIVKYLLNNRKHATYWNSTRDTAYAIEALADYMKASGEDEPDMTVEILVDGQKKKEVKITAKDLFTMDNTFVLSGKEISGGKHTIEVKKTGKGPLYYNAYVTNFTLEDMITRAGLEVKVNRKFYKLVKVDKSINVSGSRGQVVSQKVEKYDRVELANLAELKSGDLLEVELELESKNDYEYVLFEDMKAAGAEAVEVRSGYNGNSMGAYVEFRDNRVAFFIRSLARGKHSVSYRLRAEIPGQFSALPAKAIGMYAPELVGNSDELKLRIVD